MNTHNESSCVNLESAISKQPDIASWQEIDWKAIERYVLKIQQRIYRAESLKETRKVKKLQRLLLRSEASLLLAIRKVTQLNKGKRTEGVDGVKSLTEKQRIELFNKLRKESIFLHNPKPARRTYIAKNGNPNKLRPLGIPTIKDRVYQKLMVMALEPQWEERFESISYGFRPKRSAHDAISAIYSKVNKGKEWVFEGDFKGCFDNLNHDWILEQIKEFPGKDIVLKWLKAGYLDNNVFVKTDKGTPQGGIISPLLANIALHGMEHELGIRYRWSTTNKSYEVRSMMEKGERYTITVVRYADDFVILCDREKDAKAMYDRLKPYLAKRGIELSPEKTRITTVSKGFDFLGFNIRRYRYKDYKKNKEVSKILIKPNKKSIAKLKDKIRREFETNKGRNVEAIIGKLNPIIRGTANYWKTQVAKEIFCDIDHYIWVKTMKFLKRMHPKKGKKWIINRYFKSDNSGQSKDRWILTAPTSKRQLRKMAWTAITRHATIKWKNTPYDSTLKEYFNERAIKEFKANNVETRIKLAEKQKYKCPLCGKHLNNGEGNEAHHKHSKVNGGSDELKNLCLVHTSCHILWHKSFPANGPMPSDICTRAWLKSRGIYVRKKDLIANGLMESSYRSKKGIYNAYIDGSYNEDTEEYGLGIVAVYNGEQKEYAIKGSNKELTKYRNVAGELEASITAIKQAIKIKAKKIVIYHDYEGVAKYVNGDWKPKLPFTKEYNKNYNKLVKKIDVEFLWTKAHNGHKENELADKLAKQAVGIEKK